jgi:hypothetical protein
MRAVNIGSLERPLSVSINCLKYVVRDERNINVISIQEGRRSVLKTGRPRT